MQASVSQSIRLSVCLSVQCHSRHIIKYELSNGSKVISA